MAKLTIIVGVGASGKSTLCKELAEDTGATIFREVTLTGSDHKRAGFGSLGELVARLLAQNQDCVMSESHLVRADFRQTFKDFCDTFLEGVVQEWVFFENNPLACINNLEYDARENDRRELNRFKAVREQSLIYVVPVPAAWPGFENPRPVYQRDDKKFTIEREARAWLDAKIVDLGGPRARGSMRALMSSLRPNKTTL